MYRSRNSRGIFAWLLLDVIWMLLTVAALVVSILLIESATGKCLTILYAITIGKSLKKYSRYNSNDIDFSAEYLLLDRCEKLLPHWGGTRTTSMDYPVWRRPLGERGKVDNSGLNSNTCLYWSFLLVPLVQNKNEIILMRQQRVAPATCKWNES